MAHGSIQRNLRLVDGLRSSRSTVPRGAFYIGMQGAVQYVISFGTYIILTRILTQVEIGELPLLSAAMATYSTITLLSLQTATVKYVSEDAGTGNLGRMSGVVWAASKIVAATSLPSFLLLSFASPELSVFLFGTRMDANLLVLVFATGMLSNLATILVSTLWGLNLFAEMFWTNTGGLVAGRLLGVLLAWRGLHLLGYIIGWLIGATFTLALSAALSRPHIHRNYEPVPTKTLLAYSTPILASSLIGLVQSWADVTILYALTSNLVDTGVYYLGLAGSSVITIVSSAVTSAIFPTLSAYHGRLDKEAYRDGLKAAMRVVNLTILPVGFALAAVAATAVTVAYGRNYVNAAGPFAIFIASSIIPAYGAILTIALQARAYTRPFAVVAAVGAVTEAGLTATLVLPLNLLGPALARLAMGVAAALLMFWYARGEWWPELERHSLAVSIVLSVIIAGILFFLDSLLTSTGFTPLVRLLGEAGTFIVLYSTGILILKPLLPQDIGFLEAALPARTRGFVEKIAPWVTRKNHN